MFVEFIKSKISIKQLKIIIIILFIFLLFKGFIKSIYATLVIENVLKYFETGLISDIIFFTAFISFIYILVEKIKKNFQFSINQLFVNLIILCGYFYYRNIDGSFEFYSISITNKIYYCDILLIPFLISLIVIIKNYVVYIKKSVPIGGFITDNPLGKYGVDEYGREKYAKNLAEMVDKTSNDSSLAIGINGRWGSGKSSFLDLIIRHLDNDDIVIDFNPWNSINKGNIVMDFFDKS